MFYLIVFELLFLHGSTSPKWNLFFSEGVWLISSLVRWGAVVRGKDWLI